MAVTPNPTAELRRRPGPSPTRDRIDTETHADVDAGVGDTVEARNSLVVSTGPESYRFITQMNPASWAGLEGHAGLEVSGRRWNAGYIRDSSTGTGFSASRVPGSRQRVVELRSRVPIGALAALYAQGRATP